MAWFRVNGGDVDPIALGLAGYALLMAIVQIRLIPLHRTVPFGPGWWAFSFPYAATAAFLLQWLCRARDSPAHVDLGAPRTGDGRRGRTRRSHRPGTGRRSLIASGRCARDPRPGRDRTPVTVVGVADAGRRRRGSVSARRASTCRRATVGPRMTSTGS